MGVGDELDQLGGGSRPIAESGRTMGSVVEERVGSSGSERSTRRREIRKVGRGKKGSKS